jgi:hypothetical protein
MSTATQQDSWNWTGAPGLFVLELGSEKEGLENAEELLGLNLPVEKMSPGQRALSKAAEPIFVATSVEGDEGVLVYCSESDHANVQNAIRHGSYKTGSVLVGSEYVDLVQTIMREREDKFSNAELQDPRGKGAKQPAVTQDDNGSLTAEDDLPKNPGTLLHPNECKPCAFYCRQRCANGDTCDFCHHPSHPRTRGKRRCRKRKEGEAEVEDDDEQGPYGDTPADERGFIKPQPSYRLPNPVDAAAKGKGNINPWRHHPAYPGKGGPMNIFDKNPHLDAQQNSCAFVFEATAEEVRDNLRFSL